MQQEKGNSSGSWATQSSNTASHVRHTSTWQENSSGQAEPDSSLQLRQLSHRMRAPTDFTDLWKMTGDIWKRFLEFLISDSDR